MGSPGADPPAPPAGPVGPAGGATRLAGLLTDHYELTMLQAALRSGAAFTPVVFEVFARALPAGRRYGVLAGTGRLLAALPDFRFSPDELAWLRERAVVDDETLAWLADYRFAGGIDGYPEGEVYSPGCPVLTVWGSFAECVLLETFVLSVLNFDSAVAAAGARMVGAAAGRACVEMGARRTHEQAGVAAARAAYLVGFAATSELAAGRTYGVPTTGTSAHSFILAHADERTAFAAQVAALGASTTLLLDTYDVAAAVRTAVEVAGVELGAVRLDSGDLADTARTVRATLDSLGARDTRIVVTSDLDEYAIAALAAAPVDAYGVGTALVTGSGAPTAGFVYKLVERAGTPVGKASTGKATLGGRKTVRRQLGDDGVGVAELVCTNPFRCPTPGRAGGSRALQVPLVRRGDVLATGSPAQLLEQAREHHRRAIAELPAEARKLSRGSPALPVVYRGTPAGVLEDPAAGRGGGRPT